MDNGAKLPLGRVPRARAELAKPTGETFLGWKIRRDSTLDGSTDILMATHPEFDEAPFSVIRWYKRSQQNSEDAMTVLKAMIRRTMKEATTHD